MRSLTALKRVLTACAFVWFFWCQALAIGRFCHEFLFGKKWAGPDASVLKRVEMFHTDSVVCGLSALALKTNSPTVLRSEALEEYASANGAKHSAYVFGSDVKVASEKAVVANVAAVREWDSNGTVFGYNEKLNHKAGEFGHNDFYPGMLSYDDDAMQRAMQRAVAVAMCVLCCLLYVCVVPRTKNHIPRSNYIRALLFVH